MIKNLRISVTFQCICDKCQKKWINSSPKVCPQCKSSNWNSDSTESPIIDWYNNLTHNQKNQGVTVFQAIADNSLPTAKSSEMEVANIFSKHLNLKKKQTMTNGTRSSKWF